MDDNEKQLTPLGAERTTNPGQVNVTSNPDGTSAAPNLTSWDENTSLGDIANQYTDVANKYGGIVENAANNVGDRQAQLIGNDFGGTNPYMFNTYYEPAATSFASKMRVAGTQAALSEGMTRAKKEADEKAKAAQQNYTNAYNAAQQRAAEEQRRRNAQAYVSETDTSKIPQGVNEKDLINSEAYYSMSDKEKEDAWTSARTKDVQDYLKSNNLDIDWNKQDQRNVATDSTLSKFGMTRDQLNAMSQEEKDAFWARTDVGNYWTEQYMIKDFQNRGSEMGKFMVDSFNEIHTEVRQIVDMFNNIDKYTTIDSSLFTTKQFKDLGNVENFKFDDIQNAIKNSDLDEATKGRYLAAMDSYGNGVGKDMFAKDISAIQKGYRGIAYENGAFKEAFRNSVLEGIAPNKKIGSTFTFDGKSYTTLNTVRDIYEKFAYATSGGVAEPESEFDASTIINDASMAVTGVSYTNLESIADLKANRPDDFEYLLNQAAYVLSIKDPIEIVEDENKEYFVNGEWKKLKAGDIVMHTPDGTVDADGNFVDKNLEEYVNLVKKINNGEEELTPENEKILTEAYSEYQETVIAALAASGNYNASLSSDIYSAVLNMKNGYDGLVVNPNSPDSKIKASELIKWFEGKSNDEKYALYTAIATKSREARGHMFIYSDDIKGVTDRTLSSNGESTIGKKDDKNAQSVEKLISNLSAEDCLAVNMILDAAIKNGDIDAKKFFSSDGVSAVQTFSNAFVDSLVGTVKFAESAVSAGLGLVTGNEKFKTYADKTWKEMTTLDASDDFRKNSGDALLNPYTAEVRKNQRRNLNHLIDTTFNVDYFNPNNTYDMSTGELKDKNGNVVSYEGDRYNRYDKASEVIDTVAEIAGTAGEMIAETLATEGAAAVLRGINLATKGASGAAKTAKVAEAASKLEKTTTAIAVNSAKNPELVLKYASATKYLDDISRLGVSSVDNVTGTGVKVAENVLAKSADNLLEETAVSAAEKGSLALSKNIDDVASGAYKARTILSDGSEIIYDEAGNIVKAVGESAEKVAKVSEEALGAARNKLVRDNVLDMVADVADEAKRIGSKFTKYVDETLNLSTNGTAFFGTMSDSSKKAMSNIIKSNAQKAYQSAAKITRISEATGIAAERISALPNSVRNALYSTLRVAEGSPASKAEMLKNLGSYVKASTTGGDVAKGLVDFKKAVNAVVESSERLAARGGKLSVDDVYRIIAKEGSKEGSALFKSLKAADFMKERAYDMARDIAAGYYTPTLDEKFESNYTSAAEYITDPVQIASGIGLDIAASAGRRGINKLSRSYHQSAANRLINSVDFSSSADNATLAKNISKLNGHRAELERLTNKALDGKVTPDKVKEATEKATESIDKYIKQNIDMFDANKTMDIIEAGMKDAVENTTVLDKVRQKTGLFGKSKVMRADETRRYLMRSNKTLETFYASNEALKGAAISRFANYKQMCPNMFSIDKNNWTSIMTDAIDNIKKTNFTNKYGDVNFRSSKDGSSILKTSDKALAKDIYTKAQTEVYDHIYNAIEKKYAGLKQTNPSFFSQMRSEVNFVRDEMIKSGMNLIDEGVEVRANYLPIQALIWDTDNANITALWGYSFGSGGEHTSISSQIADPTKGRAVFDIYSIADDIKNGKTTYERDLSAKELAKNAADGISDSSKQVSYNLDGWNPILALTAYKNSLDGKKLNDMINPMKNGSIFVASDDAVKFGVDKAKLNMDSAIKTREAELKTRFEKESKAKSQKRAAKDINRIKTSAAEEIESVKKKISDSNAKKVSLNRDIRRMDSEASNEVLNSDIFLAFKKITDPLNNKEAVSNFNNTLSAVRSDIEASKNGTFDSDDNFYKLIIDSIAKNDSSKLDDGNIITTPFGDINTVSLQEGYVDAILYKAEYDRNKALRTIGKEDTESLERASRYLQDIAQGQYRTSSASAGMTTSLDSALDASEDGITLGDTITSEDNALVSGLFDNAAIDDSVSLAKKAEDINNAIKTISSGEGKISEKIKSVSSIKPRINSYKKEISPIAKKAGISLYNPFEKESERGLLRIKREIDALGKKSSEYSYASGKKISIDDAKRFVSYGKNPYAFMSDVSPEKIKQAAKKNGIELTSEEVSKLDSLANEYSDIYKTIHNEIDSSVKTTKLSSYESIINGLVNNGYKDRTNILKPGTGLMSNEKSYVSEGMMIKGITSGRKEISGLEAQIIPKAGTYGSGESGEKMSYSLEISFKNDKGELVTYPFDDPLEFLENSGFIKDKASRDKIVEEWYEKINAVDNVDKNATDYFSRELGKGSDYEDFELNAIYEEMDRKRAKVAQENRRQDNSSVAVLRSEKPDKVSPEFQWKSDIYATYDNKTLSESYDPKSKSTKKNIGYISINDFTEPLPVGDSFSKEKIVNNIRGLADKSIDDFASKSGKSQSSAYKSFKNEVIDMAYENMAINKASDDSITLAEVYEEFNRIMPGFDEIQPYSTSENNSILSLLVNARRLENVGVSLDDIENSVFIASKNPSRDLIVDTSKFNISESKNSINRYLYGDESGKSGYFDSKKSKLSEIEALEDKTNSEDLEKLNKLMTEIKSAGDTEDAIKGINDLKAYVDENVSDSTLKDKIKETIKREERFLKKNNDLESYLSHDLELYTLKQASEKNIVSGANAFKSDNSPLLLGSSVRSENHVKLSSLRESATPEKFAEGKGKIAKAKNAIKDKNILKSMQSDFNGGLVKKTKLSQRSYDNQNKWIDNLVSEVSKSTGNPDITADDIFIDKDMALLGRQYFGEGKGGIVANMGEFMNKFSGFNKAVQSFHLAGGIGQYNAFTLRNAVTMMWQDPVGGIRALFTNFNNAKDNDSVRKFFVDNNQKLMKYALDSGDWSIVNAFAPVISMDDRIVGGGMFSDVCDALAGNASTIAENSSKISGLVARSKGVYEAMFDNPTFARWAIIAKADMQLRNYDKAEKFVNRMIQRYGLDDESFASMEGGMGSKDAYIATLARLRTDHYWDPASFMIRGNDTSKYLDLKSKEVRKSTAESLRSVPQSKSFTQCMSDFFFAINYKLQMNAHPINGIATLFSSVYEVPHAGMAARSGASLSPLAARFASRGDRNQILTMIGITALAHAWNTSIGAPSAWEDLWTSVEDIFSGDAQAQKERGTRGISQSLMNLQDFGKFWMPNDGGKFDRSQTGTAIDPFFSVFTLQNSGARAINKFLYPNQNPINWQRTGGELAQTNLGRRITGVMDELVGANLLAGYKSVYEILNNSTYFGNNIWERKYMPNGELNPNYNPLRNIAASTAHILNLDGWLSGNGLFGKGTNKWVKGLDMGASPLGFVGEEGQLQDRIGTVSGSGIIQHEYVTAFMALQDGDYFGALTESMELPIKTRNYDSRARTALNNEVVSALRQAKNKYDAAGVDKKDDAYKEFATTAVNILHDWSRKHGDVLGRNDELTSTAAKVLSAFLANEYDDDTLYRQTMYNHVKQEMKLANGDQLLFTEGLMKEAIANGLDPVEAAEIYNKHSNAYKEAQIAEYNARQALREAGINEGLSKPIFDDLTSLVSDKKARNVTASKRLVTEVKARLDSKVGEFSNMMEKKAYYEELIANASTTKQKAALAEQYNTSVTDIIAPYIEGNEQLLNSAYWDGDHASNIFGQYLIIPANKNYRGSTPRASYLKDLFGVGFRNTENLPSDEQITEQMERVKSALAKGQLSSANALIDNALVQSRKGVWHTSDEDYEQLLRLRALISSRSK